MKLILSSCDFGNPESAAFIASHLPRPIGKLVVLYFPNEKATPEKIKSGRYESRLEAFGFRRENIHVADYFSPAATFACKPDVIYISGGSTFGTMKRIREAGFDRLIVTLVRSGVLYIGGSAGAHIASADLSHVRAYDTDTFGLTDLSGLSLHRGILVCHFTEARRADFERLAAEGRDVAALTDAESMYIEK